MKKLLVTVSVILMTAATSLAQNCKCCPTQCNCPPPPPGMQRPTQPKINLDEKLRLTEEQKIKAKEIRLKGHKEIAPLFDKLHSKQEQKRALLNSQINKKEQIEMIDNLNEEIMSLKRQIHEARVRNMKEFESILTDKQKKTLEEIKVQSRKDFQKQHKCSGIATPCKNHKN